MLTRTQSIRSIGINVRNEINHDDVQILLYTEWFMGSNKVQTSKIKVLSSFRIINYTFSDYLSSFPVLYHYKHPAYLEIVA